MKRIFIVGVTILILLLAIIAVWLCIPHFDKNFDEEESGKMGTFCRMTGGTFIDGGCICPSIPYREEPLKVPLIYNEETGFCEIKPGVPYFDDGATVDA
ncbi:MAG: hypothetical protein WCT28_00510 [Patescibacteria group bacterium]|jgi:hypothetical protein